MNGILPALFIAALVFAAWIALAVMMGWVDE